MSWLERLIETYDACFGQPQFEAAPLTPIDHVEQQAHIEIALDAAGNFLRAAVVNKEPTLIPATEESAGRTSGPVAHPLCDKLRYVAADLEQSDHVLYVEQLRRWAQESKHPKLRAILSYVERGSIIDDLIREQILRLNTAGKLELEWASGPSALAKLLSSDEKTKQRDQGDAIVRWRVEVPNDYESAVWKDSNLRDDWIAFNATLSSSRGLCFSSGKVERLSANHPKSIRRPGDQAKLISTNDSPFDAKGKRKQHGYTFIGRFQDAHEAYGLGSAATQKAHNALRWLISRQGTQRNGTQVIVAWAVRDALSVPVLGDSFDFLDGIEDEEQSEAGSFMTPSYTGDAGQQYARQLAKSVNGYGARLQKSQHFVVMALDSATSGRLAVLFYRDLTGSEFLTRLERWHSVMAWPQNLGKGRCFTGAPAPRDIARAAFGKKVKNGYEADEKILKATVARILPCIIDARPIPKDLIRATVAQTIRLASLQTPESIKESEFERSLGIACALIRSSNKKEDQSMALDEKRVTRSYLYGRLLAVAEAIERRALKLAKEKRETSANRYFQAFADRPFETWLILAKGLKPYEARLRSSYERNVKFLNFMERLRDDIADKFDQAEFILPRTRLDAEFLLGYYCQRAALNNFKAVQDLSNDAEAQGDHE